MVAAIISVCGSAALAGLGALAQWYRRRKKKQTVAQTLTDLQTHPVLFLEQDAALEVTCHDATKAALLNALRIAIICMPTRQELRILLSSLRTHASDLTCTQIEQAVGLAREQLQRSQQEALQGFPTETHAVVRKMITSHGDALATASDLFSTAYAPCRALELVFNVFYVSTFTVLSQWAQTANQLNGHLNGLLWEGRRLGYSFAGNVTDAVRILAPAVQLLQRTTRELDCFACLVSPCGVIEAACGSLPCVGYSSEALLGLTPSVLQLGLEGLSSEEDLRVLFQGDLLESTRALVPVLSKSGQKNNFSVFVSQVRVALPESRLLRLSVFVREEDELGESTASEDAHTRTAFLLSALTHPVRRVVVGCRSEPGTPHVVEAAVDGAPDLPAFAPQRPLHTQMEVAQRRVDDMCARCRLRLQSDLLRSATLSYSWHGSPVVAEFYLVGKEGPSEALLSIHRPVLATPAETKGGRSGGALVERARRVRPRRVFGDCFRAQESGAEPPDPAHADLREEDERYEIAECTTNAQQSDHAVAEGVVRRRTVLV